MSRVQAALQQERASTSTEDVLEAVRVALADATWAYAAALADGARERYGSVFNLLEHASRRLTAVASVDRPEGRDDAVRNWLADQLAPEVIRDDVAIIATGRSRYPNQINPRAGHPRPLPRRPGRARAGHQ